MVFSDSIVRQAWVRAEGRCECLRGSHSHHGRCNNKQLIWGNRGREGRDAWKVYHRSSTGGDTLTNCEIVCWNCENEENTTPEEEKEESSGTEISELLESYFSHQRTPLN